jgi:hypothetical protein
MKIAQLKLIAVAFLALFAVNLHAGNIYVPNYSFELPNIGTNSPYAAPVFDDWVFAPQPAYYDPTNFGGPWEDLAGTFYNLPDFTNSAGTNNTYIFNCDGVQAAFFFALPQVGISQVLDATYDVGKTYTMTVGLIGGGGGMTNGSTFELNLYYLDGTNMVTVGSATVTNTTAAFPTDTEFVDFSVQVPEVQATNAWAGQNIGIQLLATPDPYNPGAWGGFWDVDNVRLTGSIYIPNFSFESPDIGTNSPYAAPVFDDWMFAPQPSYYDPTNFGGPWEDLAGTFYNLPNFTNSSGTNNTYIFNCNGVQAAFLFALPDVGISQQIEATYKAGKTYTLTVGLLGGGGGMTNGSTFELSLYYLDDTNMITVAESTLTNTPANFPTDEEFVDFQVQTPGVQATDPWAGQNIGIQLLATPDPYNPFAWGGFWDADNVRLSETTTLNLATPALSSGQMQFTVLSDPGAVVQVLATSDLTLPVANWTSLATLTNTSGNMTFVDESATLSERFYAVKPSP